MSIHAQFCVGITGGIGSGKTTVSELFSSLGIPVIDTDQISHQLTAQGGAAVELIRTTFGSDFITSAGAMNRSYMRTFIFSDSHAKKKLESLLHPMIFKEVQKKVYLTTSDYAIIVVPLLAECKFWQKYMARILVVDCTEEQQIERVAARNNLPTSEIRNIMGTQASRADRLTIADDVIYNMGTCLTLATEVARLHTTYIALSKKKL